MANTNKYISLSKLGLYDEKIKKVITDGDAATLKSAKDYADSLAVNYDAAGTGASEAAKVTAELNKEIARATAAESANAAAAKKAQDEVDALELVVADKADQSALNALAGKVGTVPEGSTVMGIIANIQENAYDDSELRGMINGLVNTKADKTQVATDIETAVNAEKSARETAVAGVQSAVDTLSGTHATDKAALEAAIALKADQTALNATNQTLAEVKEDVDAFFNGALSDGAEQVKDTLKEIQDYINSDVEGAAAMAASIKQNADDIDALEGRMATAESDIDAVEARALALEGRMTTAEGDIAKKVDQTAYNTKVQALEQADAGQVNRIAALEAKFGEGEGNVEDMIADAKQAAIDTAAADATAKANKALEDAKAYADAEDAKVEERVTALEAASATHALASDLTALAGRVTTAEGEIDTLQSEMTAVQALAAANKSAHEANAAAIALLASQESLTAVSNRVTALENWHTNFTEASEDDINSLFA